MDDSSARVNVRMKIALSDENENAAMNFIAAPKETVAYRFLPAAVFATSACFFAWLAEFALDCFWPAFLFTDFGDLSPIIIFVWYCGLLVCGM